MSEFKFVKNKSNLKISCERIAFIFFIFFIISLLFSAKILLLSYNDPPEEIDLKKKENFRSSIIDREGDILAKSVRITNLGIDKISIAVLPFLLAYIGVLIFVSLFPDLITWLPDLVYGNFG